MRTGLVVTGTLLALLSGAAANAQSTVSQTPRAFVAAHVGIVEAGSGEAVKASGLELGALVGVHPFAGARGLGVEAGFATVSEPRGTARSDFWDEMTARQFVLRGTYTFRRHEARSRPYVFGGLAVIAVDYESACTDCVFDVDPATGRLISRGTVTERIESTKAGFTVGAGVDVRVARAAFLRFEYGGSSTTPGSGWNWGWGAARLGLGYRF